MFSIHNIIINIWFWSLDDTIYYATCNSAYGYMYINIYILSFISKRRQNESSLFDELSLDDASGLEDVDDGCDITGEYK